MANIQVDSSKPVIAIIGAGPAGLMLGRLLDLAKIPYIIFERDESPDSGGQGGTLDVHRHTGQLALRRAGLLHEFKKYARYEGVHSTFADRHGNVVYGVGPDEKNTDTERPEIDRKDLRRILLSAVPRDRIVWGAKVLRVEKRESWVVHLLDGSEMSGYKLVVGADGAWSKVRTMLTRAKYEYSGFTAFTTHIKPGNPYYSEIVSLVGRGNYGAVGDEKMVIAQRLGDESYAVNVGLRLDDDWSRANYKLMADPGALRQWLLQEHFSDWAEVNTNILKHSEGNFRHWPLYHAKETTTWNLTAGLTIVGDAAHLTLPSGEGVNAAMFDSMQLARQIEKFGMDDLDKAVHAYEMEMFDRVPQLKDDESIFYLMMAPDAPKGLMEFFAMVQAGEATETETETGS